MLTSYWNQLNKWTNEVGLSAPQNPIALLTLPGVVREKLVGSVDRTSDWPVIRETLIGALDKLQEFRINEGRSIQADLQANCEYVAEQLEKVSEMAPQVVIEYRDRLVDRIRELLSDDATSIVADNLIREVSIFADKCDINEEVMRLRCHLDQFAFFVAEESSMGRKLEFLSQEMFREVNTIGSKANNVPIAHCVVEMKSAVERIRENLQNVE